MRTLATRVLKERLLVGSSVEPPVEFRDGTLEGQLNGGDLDLTLTHAPRPGDLLVICAFTRNAALTGPPEPAWTRIDRTDVGTNEYRGIWIREADDTDTATTTVACGTGGSTTAIVGLLARFSPARLVDWDVVFGGSSGTGGLTAPSVGGQTGGMLLCVWATHADDSGGFYIGVPAPMVEIGKLGGGPATMDLIAGYEALTTDGPTGTRTVLQNGVDQWTEGVSISLARR